jgi:hypothetical protein
MPKAALSLPAHTIFELEQWGIRTAHLFQRLRVESGAVPPNTPPDQTWFWSKQWQEQEQQADHDLATGQVEVFNSVDDLLADLGA